MNHVKLSWKFIPMLSLACTTLVTRPWGFGKDLLIYSNSYHWYNNVMTLLLRLHKFSMSQYIFLGLTRLANYNMALYNYYSGNIHYSGSYDPHSGSSNDAIATGQVLSTLTENQLNAILGAEFTQLWMKPMSCVALKLWVAIKVFR